MARSKRNSHAHRRQRELDRMAMPRKIRQAKAMLMGGEYILWAGMIRVETNDPDDTFYAYYDHDTIQRLSNDEADRRLRVRARYGL